MKPLFIEPFIILFPMYIDSVFHKTSSFQESWGTRGQPKPDYCTAMHEPFHCKPKNEQRLRSCLGKEEKTCHPTACHCDQNNCNDPGAIKHN